MDRRKFIGLTGAAAFFSAYRVSKSRSEAADIDPDLKDNYDFEEKIPLLKPRALKKGDLIAITAPASHASFWEIRKSLRFFKRLGLKVEVGDTIKKYKKRYRYFSAPDEQRAEEFMKYAERKDVSAIVAVRGGFGSARILKYLDFESIRRNPKIVLGFSDITALLNAIYHNSNLLVFHGPVAVSSFNSLTAASFKRVLLGGEQKPRYFSPSIRTIVGGKARGKLIGGNLITYVSLLGTPYLKKLDSFIFFLEESIEDPYVIDRALTHLLNAGAFKNCEGVILGKFANYSRAYNFFPYPSFKVKDVIESFFKKLGVPTIVSAPIGHAGGIWTLPIGVEIELDADKRLFRTLHKPTL